MPAQNLYTHQEENVAKTWVLMAVFLGIVVAVGFAASWYFNSSVILYAAIIFALATNIWSYWNSDKIALAMSRAIPADPVEFVELHRVVENLAITAGLPKPRVYIIKDASPNAFATGRDAKHAAVAVTTGLLRIMNKTELEGVIAHELSHVGNRDILVSTIAVVLVGFVALVSNFFLRVSFFGGGDREEKNNPVLAVIAILFIVIAPIAASLLQLAVSRKREFLADASGALLTRYPEGLASALRKLEQYGQPMKGANNATAHLFISNPFGVAQARGGIARLFATHPPLPERIKALVGEE